MSLKPRKSDILEKLTVAHLIHKSVSYDEKGHRHACYPMPDESTLQTLTWYLFLDLPYRLLASGFMAQNPFLISPTYATKPPLPFTFVNLIFCGHKSLSSSMCNFLHPATSSMKGPIIFLSTLPSYTPRCSLTINQVSHPHTTLIV